MKEKYQAAALGLAIADAVGAPFEIMEAKAVATMIAKDSRLDGTLQPVSFERIEEKGQIDATMYPAGFYTDDTANFICLGESLIEKGFNTEDQFNRYRDWLFNGYAQPAGYKSMGSGGTTRRALATDYQDPAVVAENPKANSDGSLMRDLAIGLAYRGDYEALKEKSIAAAYVTHPNKESAWTCVIYSALVSLVLDGESDLKSALKFISQIYPEMPHQLQLLLENNFADPNGGDFVKPGFKAVDALNNVLWAFEQSQTYRESIEKVIRIGGDTDTYGAIVGGLMGAKNGLADIPTDWLAPLLSQDRIRNIGTGLYELNQNLNH